MKQELTQDAIEKLQLKYGFYFTELNEHPQALHLLIKLADTCLALDKRKEALLYYKKALGINPTDEHIISLMQNNFSTEELKDVVFVSKPKPFWSDFRALCQYPLKKNGWLAVFGGALLGAVFSSMPLVGGFVTVVFFLPYVFAFLYAILKASSKGDAVLPGWPDFADIWNEIIRPYVMILVTCATSFWPIIIYWFLDAYLDIHFRILIPIRLVFGIIYLPISLIAIAVYDRILTALQFRLLLTSIWKIRNHYLIAVVACVCFIGLEWLLTLFMPYYLILIGPFIFWIVALYLSIIIMYILGNLYVLNKERLDMFYWV